MFSCLTPSFFNVYKQLAPNIDSFHNWVLSPISGGWNHCKENCLTIDSNLLLNVDQYKYHWLSGLFFYSFIPSPEWLNCPVKYASITARNLSTLVRLILPSPSGIVYFTFRCWTEPIRILVFPDYLPNTLIIVIQLIPAIRGPRVINIHLWRKRGFLFLEWFLPYFIYWH